jgi:plasmid stabilization system protein ParE
MPHIGRKVPEFPKHNFYEIIFKNYRIVYKISNDEQIQILAIVHFARDFENAMIE